MNLQAAINHILQQTSLILRPMTLADLSAVMEIERAAYATPWLEVAYQRELQYNERAYLDVLQYKAKIVAYSCLWDLVDQVHIGTLVTAPQMRGKGLGQLLLLQAIWRSSALNVQSISLEVRPSNRPAIGLYKKFGFKEEGRRSNYYADKEDALIMTTPLLNSAEYQTLLVVRLAELEQRMQNFKPI